MGLLQPLPIPEHPWASALMNFIIDLLVVSGKGSILVVVDRFSKYVVFMAAPSHCPAEEAAALFLSRVVKHFGLASNIVSDRNMWLTGRS